MLGQGLDLHLVVGIKVSMRLVKFVEGQRCGLIFGACLLLGFGNEH